jgi:hypothetical protein
MKNMLIIAAALAAVRLSAAPVDWSQLPPAATVTGVTFDKDIAPLFKASCVRCHSGERPRSQLRLDSLDGVLKGSKDGPVLTAGDSANSLLVKAISQLDPKLAMPPKPRGPRPMGTNAPAMRPPGGGPDAGGPPPGGPGGPEGPGGPGGPGGPPPMAGPGGPPLGGEPGSPGTNGPGHFQDHMRPMGPPPKPLTADQVGLVRAWIDQGAK